MHERDGRSICGCLPHRPKPPTQDPSHEVTEAFAKVLKTSRVQQKANSIPDKLNYFVLMNIM